MNYHNRPSDDQYDDYQGRDSRRNAPNDPDRDRYSSRSYGSRWEFDDEYQRRDSSPSSTFERQNPSGFGPGAEQSYRRYEGDYRGGQGEYRDDYDQRRPRRGRDQETDWSQGGYDQYDRRSAYDRDNRHHGNSQYGVTGRHTSGNMARDEDYYGYGRSEQRYYRDDNQRRDQRNDGPAQEYTSRSRNPSARNDDSRNWSNYPSARRDQSLGAAYGSFDPDLYGDSYSDSFGPTRDQRDYGRTRDDYRPEPSRRRSGNDYESGRYDGGGERY